jgi:indole-3-glycerol phosphate synthase/phosphoribosylanthranilate isomerase
MFLDRIVAQTRIDLEQRKSECSLEEMQARARSQPGPRDLLEVFKDHSRIGLVAEVKRASPSRGMLAPHLDPVELARTYEANGAVAISVLTERHFFLGAPEYLTAIKQAVQIPVLRKDFIIDEYQVYEARAWGADAILLICAILDDAQLRYLLQVAHALRMRCLVEAHSKEEVQRAVKAGANIIGVNSRDLKTFEMHPSLIREIRQFIPSNRVVIAESGIHTAADARRLARYDVQGMLVGESLVISNDIPEQMRILLQGANESIQVKICGLRQPETIDTAIAAGADMLGFVFYKPSHRFIEPQRVRAALEACRFALPSQGRIVPDLVGIFVNESPAFINEVIEQAGLNFVQLHGTESPEQCTEINRPVIKAIPTQNESDLARIQLYKEACWRILLDTPTPSWGGTGLTHNWELARTAARKTRIILAGGLTPDNVADAIQQVHPWGVDVSSGVETNKQKDTQKIRAFVQQVRATAQHPRATARRGA